MLVSITDVCRMGCSHCFDDCKPEGRYMTMSTLKQVADFIVRNEFIVAMISGGEPTEHPLLLSMIDYLKGMGIKLYLMSNGMFLDNKILTEEILARKIDVQITNDARFYPRQIEKVINPFFNYEDHIRMVSPFGRAKTNKIETSRQSPFCFNLRSVVRKVNDFRLAVYILRSYHKFCTPRILLDGGLVAGESSSCMRFGHVSESNQVLTKRLSEIKCNRCGLMDNLDEQFKQAVGEE